MHYKTTIISCKSCSSNVYLSNARFDEDGKILLTGYCHKCRREVYLYTSLEEVKNLLKQQGDTE